MMVLMTTTMTTTTLMIVHLWSAQTSTEKPCSWRLLGQPLYQMVNNKKHTERKRRRDGWWCSHWFENKWALEFLRKSWRRFRFSQRLREGIPELGGRIGESPEAELLFGMVSTHTWNTTATLRRWWSKRPWWSMARNQLLTLQMTWAIVDLGQAESFD